MLGESSSSSSYLSCWGTPGIRVAQTTLVAAEQPQSLSCCCSAASNGSCTLLICYALCLCLFRVCDQSLCNQTVSQYINFVARILSTCQGSFKLGAQSVWQFYALKIKVLIQRQFNTYPLEKITFIMIIYKVLK